MTKSLVEQANELRAMAAKLENQAKEKQREALEQIQKLEKGYTSYKLEWASKKPLFNIIKYVADEYFTMCEVYKTLYKENVPWQPNPKHVSIDYCISDGYIVSTGGGYCFLKGGFEPIKISDTEEIIIRNGDIPKRLIK